LNVALRDLIKPHIRALEPYAPGKPIEELERELGISGSVKLASNETPLGPSPKAVAAVQKALASIHRYPDGASFELRRKLAGRLEVDEDQLVFGCGGDEILELLAKVLLGPGDECIYPWPSFAMYPIVVQGMGATPVPVPLDADFAHDLDAMAAAVNERTKLIFVCNPNNPTGTTFGAAELDRFMESLPEDVVVAIDEAYVDFARRPDFPDSLAWVRRRPGTLVLRTFSKIVGLAGLRVGYGAADTELAGYLQRARHPFNVNRLAEVAAVAALDDGDFIQRVTGANKRGLDYLSRELRGLGIEVWPSEANFVLARTGENTYERLLQEGVIVRPMAGFGLPDCVRISVGLPEENERLVKALRGAVARVVGATRNADARRAALEHGTCDEVAELEVAVRGADLLVLATPVSAMLPMLRRVAASLEPGCIVTDVGSVKGPLCDTLPGLLPPAVEYVGSHPMAGSHARGFDHADPDLFVGRPCVVMADAAADARERVARFWRALGADVRERQPDEHDAEVAWVSHLPHLLAYAFAGGLAEAPAGAQDLRGSGFEDFTRIARSDPEMWSEILTGNRKALAAPLQAVRHRLAELVEAIEADDTETLERLLGQARDALASGGERRPLTSTEPELPMAKGPGGTRESKPNS
jgi:histidinol-phosphate aminotransferase